MESGKRSWIYAGIAVAAGVGLVSSMSKSGLGSDERCRRLRCMKGGGIVLLSDAIGGGLAVPIAKLAAGSKMRLVAHHLRAGSTTRLLADPVREFVATRKPDLVLVAVGGDELRAAGKLDAAALRRLATAIEDAGAPVVWIGPPMASQAAAGALLAPGREVFSSSALKIDRGPDGTTPTAAGYAGWAGAIWRWLS